MPQSGETEKRRALRERREAVGEQDIHQMVAGSELSAVVPVPSWLWLFHPQQRTDPASTIARWCELPTVAR